MLSRHHWKWIVAALLAAGLALPSAANPPTELGKFLAQNGYIPMQVDNNGHNQGIVRMSINGVGGTLALDTGCIRTCITNSFARALKLDIQKAYPMVGAGGKIEGAGFASINSFTLNDSPNNRTAPIP